MDASSHSEASIDILKDEDKSRNDLLKEEENKERYKEEAKRRQAKIQQGQQRVVKAGPLKGQIVKVLARKCDDEEKWRVEVQATGKIKSMAERRIGELCLDCPALNIHTTVSSSPLQTDSKRQTQQRSQLKQSKESFTPIEQDSLHFMMNGVKKTTPRRTKSDNAKRRNRKAADSKRRKQKQSQALDVSNSKPSLDGQEDPLQSQIKNPMSVMNFNLEEWDSDDDEEKEEKDLQAMKQLHASFLPNLMASNLKQQTEEADLSRYQTLHQRLRNRSKSPTIMKPKSLIDLNFDECDSDKVDDEEEDLVKRLSTSLPNLAFELSSEESSFKERKSHKKKAKPIERVKRSKSPMRQRNRPQSPISEKPKSLRHLKPYEYDSEEEKEEDKPWMKRFSTSLPNSISLDLSEESSFESPNARKRSESPLASEGGVPKSCTTGRQERAERQRKSAQEIRRDVIHSARQPPQPPNTASDSFVVAKIRDTADSLSPHTLVDKTKTVRQTTRQSKSSVIGEPLVPFGGSGSAAKKQRSKQKLPLAINEADDASSETIFGSPSLHMSCPALFSFEYDSNDGTSRKGRLQKSRLGTLPREKMLDGEQQQQEKGEDASLTRGIIAPSNNRSSTVSASRARTSSRERMMRRNRSRSQERRNRQRRSSATADNIVSLRSSLTAKTLFTTTSSSSMVDDYDDYDGDDPKKPKSLSALNTTTLYDSDNDDDDYGGRVVRPSSLSDLRSARSSAGPKKRMLKKKVSLLSQEQKQSLKEKFEKGSTLAARRLAEDKRNNAAL